MNSEIHENIRNIKKMWSDHIGQGSPEKQNSEVCTVERGLL